MSKISPEDLQSALKKEGKDDTYKAKFLPCNISGAEMEMIVNSVIALGNMLGMFDGEE